MKEEALKLADWLDKSISADDFGEMAKYYQWCQKNVSPMIRRLVEELHNADTYIDNLKKQIQHLYKQGYRQEHCCPDCGCHFVGEYPFNNAPQTKPLSDEEMKELINNFPIIFSPQDLLSFARAIEERHGIK